MVNKLVLQTITTEFDPLHVWGRVSKTKLYFKNTYLIFVVSVHAWNSWIDIFLKYTFNIYRVFIQDLFGNDLIFSKRKKKKVGCLGKWSLSSLQSNFSEGSHNYFSVLFYFTKQSAKSSFVITISCLIHLILFKTFPRPF